MKEKFDYYDSGISSIMFVVLQYLFIQLYYSLPESFRVGAVVIIASCLVEGVFLLAAYLTSRISKTKFLTATTLNKKVNTKGVLYSIAISVIFLVFASPLTNVFASFLDKIGYVSDKSIEINNFLTYIINIVVICIIPAVTEEALFRGCIVGGLKEKNKHIAVFVGAIFFMLMHGGPDQTVHQFIMGIIGGYIFVYTGNLWYPIIIHFANNFMAVTMTYIYSGGAASQTIATIPTWNEIGVSLIYAVIMAAAGAAILYFLIRELVKESKENKQLNDDNTITTAAAEPKTDLEAYIKTNTKSDKRPAWVPIAFFVISGAYLILEWVATLLLGLGVV